MDMKLTLDLPAPIRAASRSTDIKRLASAGLLILLGCRTPAPTPGPLLGTWRSDKQLTLLEVGKTNLSEKQREILSGPGFFGMRTVRFEEGKARAELDGQASWMPYRVVHSEKDCVEIEYMDPATGEMMQRKVMFDGELMKMPIRTLGFYEVFRRVDSEQHAGD